MQPHLGGLSVAMVGTETPVATHKNYSIGGARSREPQWDSDRRSRRADLFLASNNGNVQ